MFAMRWHTNTPHNGSSPQPSSSCFLFSSVHTQPFLLETISQHLADWDTQILCCHGPQCTPFNPESHPVQRWSWWWNTNRRRVGMAQTGKRGRCGVLWSKQMAIQPIRHCFCGWLFLFRNISNAPRLPIGSLFQNTYRSPRPTRGNTFWKRGFACRDSRHSFFHCTFKCPQCCGSGTWNILPCQFDSYCWKQSYRW